MNRVTLGIPPFFLDEDGSYTLVGPRPDSFFNAFCSMSINDRIVLERTSKNGWKITVPSDGAAGSTSKRSWRWP